MFTILNRLRGTWSILAKVNAILLGLLFYYITRDWQVSLMVGFGYLLGESFGWGEWVGTLTTDREKCVDNQEGKHNGIRYIASLYFNPNTEWRDFSYLALALRGAYWWFLVYLPLALWGYIGYTEVIMITIFLAVAFPEVCLLAKDYPLKFKWKFFSVQGAWETQELYYGIIQDIALAFIIWSMLWVG